MHAYMRSTLQVSVTSTVLRTRSSKCCARPSLFCVRLRKFIGDRSARQGSGSARSFKFQSAAAEGAEEIKMQPYALVPCMIACPRRCIERSLWSRSTSIGPVHTKASPCHRPGWTWHGTVRTASKQSPAAGNACKQAHWPMLIFCFE